MPDSLVPGQAVEHQILQEACVHEEQAFIDPKTDHRWIGLDLVAQDVPEVLAAGHQSDLCDMRPGTLVQVKCQREDHTGRYPDLHAQGQCQDDCCQHRAEVGPGIAPGLLQDAEIHQAEDRHDDGCCQGGFRQEIDQGRERYRSEGQADSREGPGGRCCRTGIRIHDGTRKAACYRIAAREGRPQVGRAQADQFLVGIDALPLARGQCLRDGDRFNEPDDGDQQRGHEEQPDQIHIHGRHGEGRQALWNGTHDLHAFRVEAETPHKQGRDGDCRDRSRLGQDVGRHRPETERQQGPLQVLPDPEQEPGRGDTDQHGHRIDLVEAGGE